MYYFNIIKLQIHVKCEHVLTSVYNNNCLHIYSRLFNKIKRRIFLHIY